jgi:hypothetical protein
MKDRNAVRAKIAIRRPAKYRQADMRARDFPGRTSSNTAFVSNVR